MLRATGAPRGVSEPPSAASAEERLDVLRPAPQPALAADRIGFGEKRSCGVVDRAGPRDSGLRERDQRRCPVVLPTERHGGVECRTQIAVGDVVTAEERRELAEIGRDRSLTGGAVEGNFRGK